MPRFLKTVNLLFSSKRKKYDQAARLYQLISEQARRPAFYEFLQVPDTLEGRFDLLSLHVVLVMRRLPPESKLVQELFDYFFEDIDFSLREMGVGDMKVGKYVKKLAKNFLAVFQAYNSQFNAPNKFKTSLWKNLYGGQVVDEEILDFVYNYCIQADRMLKSIDILQDGPQWPSLLNQEFTSHAA